MKFSDAVQPNNLKPLIVKALGVFIIALTIKLGYLFFIKPTALGTSDSQAYEDLADSIKNGRPYQTSSSAGPGGYPTDLQRPPGYPLFIALVTFRQEITRFRVAIYQIILSAFLSGLLVMSLGLITTQKIGLLVGVLHALDWGTVIHTPLLMSESLCSITVTISILCWVYYLRNSQALYAIAGSLFLGISAIIKPAAQLILIPLLIILLFQATRKYLLIALLLAAYFIVTVPWMIRNQSQHGLFTLSAINSAALYFYVAQGALVNDSAIAIDTSQLEKRIDEKDSYWNQLAISPAERKLAMDRESWAIIKTHLPTVLLQSAKGFIRTSVGTGAETFTNALPYKITTIPLMFISTIAPLIQIMAYWVLGFVGIYKARSKAFQVLPYSAIALIAFSFIFTLIPSAMPLGYARFRTIGLPLLCIIAAIGINSLAGRGANRTAIAPEPPSSAR